jgi:hypothetical protein
MAHRPDLGRFLDLSEPTRVLQHDDHHLRRYLQAGQHVVAADVLDRTELILRRYLIDRYQLKTVFLST